MTLEKVCGQGTCGERDAQHQIVAPDLLENSVKQKCSQGSKICIILQKRTPWMEQSKSQSQSQLDSPKILGNRSPVTGPTPQCTRDRGLSMTFLCHI